MRKLSFVIQENGKLPGTMGATLVNLFKEMAGKHVHLTLEEAKLKRSLDANAYYRGVILPHVRRVMFDAGDARSLDEWHECLLESFSPMVEIVTLSGDKKMSAQRTHLMTKKEMAEFITAITAEMASRGDPVPTRDYDD